MADWEDRSKNPAATVGGTMSAHRSFATAVLVLVLAAACGGGAPRTASPEPTDQPTDVPQATDVATPTPTIAEPTAAGESATPGQPAGGLPDVTKIATGVVPSGWQQAKSEDGACAVAVPADWDVTSMPGSAVAPTMGGQVIVSDDDLAGFGSWESYKETAKSVYFGDDRLVLLDTDELFAMAAGPSSADVSVIVGRKNGDHACGALLTITANGVADLVDSGFQILYSLAPTS
jgi:hypothetical protein